MRPILVLVGTAVSTTVFAQTVTLDAYQNGKVIGNVQYARNVHGGSQTNVTTIHTTQKGITTTLVMTAVFDAKGKTVSRRLQAKAGPQSVDVQVTFSKGAAQVSILENGKKSNRTFPQPSQMTTEDASSWWFITTKPKVNVTVKSQNFDIATLKWGEIESTYKGRKSVKIGNKTINANLIAQVRSGRSSTIYADDQGMPLVIEQATTRFVRRP